MKILYVCTSTDTGGAETALRAQALAAREEGHAVKVLSLKAIGPIGKQMQEAGVEVCSLELLGKLRPLETAGALARLVRAIEEYNPCVVHAFLYRAVVLCRLAKRRTAFKLVTTPHYDLSRRNFLLRLLDRALKDADDISCAESHATASFLRQKQKYKQEKVRLITNGIDLARFRPDADAARQARANLGFGPQDVVFVCTARLSAEKNHRLLLESFARVYAKNPHLRLILAGGGPEEAKLKAFCRQNGVEQAVLFAGEVSDVYPFLLASDAFVLVSVIESLPMALLEACSCGLSSIVSKAGDMPSVVLHGESGFVCNGQDPVLLSALMAELAENKTLRKQMGQKARKRMEQYYPAPEQVYLNLYKEIK